MELIRKTFTGMIKSVNEEKGTVTATVSDETVDRHGERIAITAWTQKGLAKFRRHPVFMSSHNYRELSAQIGRVESIRVINNELVAELEYFRGAGNKEADWGFVLAKKGIAAFSVGFLATEVEEAGEERKEKDPFRTYKEVELYEISQVTIPANPSALMKGFVSEDPVISDLSKKIADLIPEEQFPLQKVEEKKVDEIDLQLKEIQEGISTCRTMLESTKEIAERLKKEGDSLSLRESSLREEASILKILGEVEMMNKSYI